MHYCLVIRIAGLEQLRQVMGGPATAVALKAMAARLPDSLDPVLNHHSIEPVTSPAELEQGYWCYCFSYRQAGEVLSDPGFMQQILLAAEARMLAVAVEVFGYATARLADVQVALTRQQDVANPQGVERAFEQRYQHLCQLDAQAEQALLALLEGEGPRVFLQSIVDIRQPGYPVIGYEALARGPAGSAIERADQLFETARRCGLGSELEKACLRAALPWQARLPDGQVLSVNASAALLLKEDVQQLLGRPRLWVELTEHLPMGEAAQLLPVLTQLAQQGTAIALDDTGCGYADMQAAQALRPGVVKLCITVIRALAQNDEVIRELKQTVQQLHALGCKVLAEGVETADQLAQVSELGVDYVQGWYFGRPQPAQEIIGTAS